MLRRYGRLLVALYVISDALLGIIAFGLARYLTSPLSHLRAAARR